MCHAGFGNLKGIGQLLWRFTLGSPRHMPQKPKVQMRDALWQVFFDQSRTELRDDPDLGEKTEHIMCAVIIHSQFSFLMPNVALQWHLIHTQRVQAFARFPHPSQAFGELGHIG